MERWCGLNGKETEEAYNIHKWTVRMKAVIKGVENKHHSGQNRSPLGQIQSGIEDRSSDMGDRIGLKSGRGDGANSKSGFGGSKDT